MKKTLLALCLFGSIAAQAETDLSCWNMYAQKGAQPILKAKIGKNKALKVTFNLQDEYFAAYYFENNHCGTGGCSKETGTLNQIKEVLKPTLIESSRSPYKGNNEYAMTLGYSTWDFKSADGPSKNQNKVYDVSARLILPTDLSQDFLKTYRIRVSSERSNALVVLDPSANTSQSGQNYLRLYCVSK